MKDIDIVLENRENARVLLTAFQTMLDSTTDMVFVKDKNLTYLAVTDPFVRMVGKQSVEEIIGKTDLDIFNDPDLAARYAADDRKMFEADENLAPFLERLPDDHGQARYGTTSKFILRNSRDEYIGLLGITRDVTKDVLAKLHHQRELEYLFELPADAYAAIFIDIQDWRIIGERRQAVSGLSIPSYETVEALVDGARHHVESGGSESAKAFVEGMTPEMLQAVYNSGKRNIAAEYTRRMEDGELHWAKAELTYLTDPDSGHLCAMIVIRDIDGRKKAEEQIRQEARTDQLTGLLNRAATMGEISRFLAESGSDTAHALLIIDVDNFKVVNDTYGHQVGDRVLMDLARAIRGCFRSTDIVGRIGGDEFFVLMKDVSSRAVIEERAGALLRAMGSACCGQEVSGSVGICMYRSGELTLEQLYERADQALYQAKRLGKNQAVYADFEQP